MEAGAGPVSMKGLGDVLVQPAPAGFGVLCVRHGPPSGCPILARLIRNRTTPARDGKNYFCQNKASPSAQPPQNHHGEYELLRECVLDAILPDYAGPKRDESGSAVRSFICRSISNLSIASLLKR